ncbi:uncharacterized protein LOC116166471 [Photinus pyralis]|uniref:uncharacterized protein LOC116166471 n=1 Tax=Photinus pyralis TaxID=7054 RepID=UPI00126700F8|nr:uncharacterized protein LOC116166471 [Photinus pyralis]
MVVRRRLNRTDKDCEVAGTVFFRSKEDNYKKGSRKFFKLAASVHSKTSSKIPPEVGRTSLATSEEQPPPDISSQVPASVGETTHKLLDASISSAKTTITSNISETSTPTLEASFPGGRTIIVQAFTCQGLPSSSIEIMVASISKATMKQYTCGLKRWWLYCQKLNLDLYDANVNTILSFLTEEFNKGASYATLNTLRSSLAFIIPTNLALDTKIKRFFRGVQMLRPSAPKYDYTWDPGEVLTFLENCDSANISFTLLSKKLATLLALATAHRVQTLSLIDIRNIHKIPDGTAIQIKIPDRIKTSRKNGMQPLLSLPFLTDRPEICVATTLEIYLTRTSSRRPKNCHKLFITLKRPHTEVTSQTLSRWIKQTLTQSGINTEIFSAHSTRHASTSAACRNGLNLDEIRRTAGWSKNSDTFAKYYNRPLHSQNSLFHALF